MADKVIDEALLEAARGLLRHLGGPSDKFIVSYLDSRYEDGRPCKTILLHGYEADLAKLDAPKEFMGYEVGWAPYDEAMGT